MAAGQNRTAGDVWDSDVVFANPEPDDSPLDISRLRILEIGSGYFKYQYPQQTTCLWSATRLPQNFCTIDGFSTPDRVLRELRAAGEGAYDVVIANTIRYSPWHPRYWARAPFEDSAPSLGFSDPAVRCERVALGQGAGAVGGDRHGRLLRHRQGFKRA